MHETHSAEEDEQPVLFSGSWSSQWKALEGKRRAIRLKTQIQQHYSTCTNSNGCRNLVDQLRAFPLLSLFFNMLHGKLQYIGRTCIYIWGTDI